MTTTFIKNAFYTFANRKKTMTTRKNIASFAAFAVLTTALVPMPALSVFAQSVVKCDPSVCGPGSGAVKASQDDQQGDLGFSISVDGQVVDGNQSVEAEKRRTDIELSEVDIQVKFDGLDVKPMLNVSTVDLRRAYTPGEPVAFNASLNYPAWISASEVRVFERGREKSGKPLAVVPVDRQGNSSWTMPESGPDEFVYVLRVYDQKGRFDETEGLTLVRSNSKAEPHGTDGGVVSAGNGEDRTAVRNIPVYGGAVTIYGRNVPQGFTVRAAGEDLPVDAENNFVVQRILPPGDHNVDVSIEDVKGDGLAFNRAINIPKNDWFYVGLADLTVGKRFGDGELLAADGDYDDVYTKGRLAFYLKGKIKGKYLLTAAADTAEGDLDTLFSNLNAKDPRHLLRRIDPDDYYPVYGDDSTLVEDAPTRGKFYVRLEKGDSHVMWGNYKTTVSGSKFVRSERGLYGAQGVYKSENVTKHGDRKVEVEAYAAQPGTLPQRDVMRGTGGSAYFLTRQDITKGSERVSVETRDEITGQITGRRYLVAGKDYSIDYIQGIIILKAPLSSTASDGDLVRGSALGDHVVNLIVQYEFTPALGDTDGYSFGGRGQAWIGDHVRLGASGLKEEAGTADNRIFGADVRLRLGQNSFVDAEIAQSEGPGYGRSTSIDGGLTINGSGTAGVAGQRAKAYSIKGQIDLSDFNPKRKGTLEAYYEKREAGFSSLDYDTAVDKSVWGVRGTFGLNDKTDLKLNYEDYSDGDNKKRREANLEINRRINTAWAVSAGVQYSDIADPAIIDRNGQRADIGLRADYTHSEDASAYVFGQVTAYRSGVINRNDRGGIGASKRLTEKVGVKGEVSYGTTGWGGLAALTYDPTADDHYYVGYRLDPDRGITGSTSTSGVERGGIVVGMRRKYNDVLSGYAENNYDAFGNKRSLTSTYGVVYTPSALWTVNGGIEYGDVNESGVTELTRTAVSASVGYKNKDAISWRLRGEGRWEDSDDGTKDRDTYLLSAGVINKLNDNWRALANVDAVISESNQSDIRNGDYIEASLGYAYRPVHNDRFNALVKYSYLHDLPGPDQVTANGATLGPSQRSHIFSADASYDVNEYLTLGGKYGFRIGEVSTTRLETDFTDSSAHLGVIRADIHVVKKWDVLVEGRVLSSPTADTVDYGALAAVYRQVGKNMKIGVGYNFGSFSDDLRDLTHDDQGIFLNVVGKF